MKAEPTVQRAPSGSLKWSSREEPTRSEYLACPIRQVVSRFGYKWSLLVLFLLNRSHTGVLRFNEMRHFMTDCSQKMLSQTLKNLIDGGPAVPLRPRSWHPVGRERLHQLLPGGETIKY